MKLSIYLDACCLNRPFDDQSQTRNHLEAEAVLATVFETARQGWEWLGSEVLDLEISKTPDRDRRVRVNLLKLGVTRRIPMEEAVVKRGQELETLGFKSYDALHVASAELGGADVMLTTDDKLLRAAERSVNHLKITIKNPLQWIQETLDDRHTDADAGPDPTTRNASSGS